MNWRTPAGGVLGLSVLLWGVMLGSSLLIFINGPSVLFTVGGGVFLWWLAVGRDAPRMWATLRAAAPSRAELESALVTLETGRRGLWLVSWLGVLIGLTQILQALDDPSAIGPAMAVCLLTVTYATVINLFAINPMRHRLEHKRALLSERHAAASNKTLSSDLDPSRDALESLRRAVKRGRVRVD